MPVTTVWHPHSSAYPAWLRCQPTMQSFASTRLFMTSRHSSCCDHVDTALTCCSRAGRHDDVAPSQQHMPSLAALPSHQDAVRHAAAIPPQHTARMRAQLFCLETTLAAAPGSRWGPCGHDQVGLSVAQPDKSPSCCSAADFLLRHHSYCEHAAALEPTIRLIHTLST